VKFECKTKQACSGQISFNKFEMTGSMIKGVVGKKLSARTPAYIHSVQQVLTQSPRKYVKCHSQQLSLGASSAYRIIQQDVKLFLYKFQMQQALHEVDKAMRVDFFDGIKMFLEDSPTVSRSLGLVMRPMLI
jgi:hypothetical protein